jgi:hypothetical protein
MAPDERATGCLVVEVVVVLLEGEGVAAKLGVWAWVMPVPATVVVSVIGVIVTKVGMRIQGGLGWGWLGELKERRITVEMEVLKKRGWRGWK